uniref:AlNc14C221G9106 protein n=1 Tax=Albugo laibachii Nc14 TaxID=890382 RepID=F0WRW4_9STRA|nr:AlNc14C221G9106 [Albugo laibachii Nc14]|eukprot:CCA24080.1 AlNc14C221G9106 [Albugo laibachii Nc14]
MVLGDSSGAKHPLFLVLKTTMVKTQQAKSENERLRHGFGKRVWKDTSAFIFPYSAKIYGNRTAWWNGYLTIDFLQFQFGERTPFCPPVLRLLDDFSGHWVPDAFKCV